MCRKTVVDVISDAVMLLAGLIQGIDMDADVTEAAHTVKEAMASLYGDSIPLGHDNSGATAIRTSARS